MNRCGSGATRAEIMPNHTQACTAAQRWHHVPAAATQGPPTTADAQPSSPPVTTSFWKWRGHTIRYQQCGSSGPAVLLIHGFGANWYDIPIQ